MAENLKPKTDVQKVMELLSDKNNLLIAQVAPSVRVSIGEEFGYPAGCFHEGKTVAALKQLGFFKVFDITVGADLTVMEESDELVALMKRKRKRTLFTSCCPSWINYVKIKFPKFVPMLSTCLSPTRMLGAVIKNYYAKSLDLTNKKLYVISVMPCVAKKQEILKGDEVDIAITTREFAELIKLNNINYNELADVPFDNPLGEYSGAGIIFGATGGVTQAVLRTAAYKLNGNQNCEVNIYATRKARGVKDVKVVAGNVELNVCIISGLINAERVLTNIALGKKHYDFVEVMSCVGGCVNGGGQPFIDKTVHSANRIIKKRAKALFDKDRKLKVKNSYQNEILQKIYKDFILKNSKNKHLLHNKK